MASRRGGQEAGRRWLSGSQDGARAVFDVHTGSHTCGAWESNEEKRRVVLAHDGIHEVLAQSETTARVREHDNAVAGGGVTQRECLGRPTIAPVPDEGRLAMRLQAHAQSPPDRS